MLQKIRKWAFAKACKKIAPIKISLSGEECEKNDFYSIRISGSDNKKLLVESLDGSLIYVYDSAPDKELAPMNIDDVDLRKVEIKYYLHNYWETYFGINSFILNCLSKKDVLKIKTKRGVEKTFQAVFNKRLLHSKPRHELLSYIIENYGIKNKEFGLISLMSDMYSIRSFGHPDKTKCINKLRIYLSSLSESGEIVSNRDGNYKVTGKAIVTLEQFQIDERRHKDSVKLQYIMVALTIVLAFLASIQAGLLKLKPIIDFTQ